MKYHYAPIRMAKKEKGKKKEWKEKRKNTPTMKNSNPTEGNNLVNNPDILECTGECVVHSYNGILLNNKKEPTTDTCNNMDDIKGISLSKRS